jgi:integrase
VAALVREAGTLGPETSLQPRVYSTLFGLIACTGLRISEALNLRLEDVTSEGLVIGNTKFGKSRLLVLHSSTRKVLGLYLTRRGQEAGACPYLFVSVKRRQLHENTARGVFRRLVESLGIAGPNDEPRPRLHDLRFYFANQVMANSPDEPKGISRHMVALTTYLGHSDVRNSYWYLEASPKLLSRIAENCESFVNGENR